MCDAGSGRCTTAAPVTLFSEDFADNHAGWTLGPEWQIGQATASSGEQSGFEDPASDFTGEGGVAGVAIGGDAGVALPDPRHAAYYLTSPEVDTRVDGSVYLTFRRWLNSDYAPYMVSAVEVLDGDTWTVLWQTGDSRVADCSWTFQSLDLTPHKSAATRVRWGFSIGDPGVYRVSSWNLDAVKIQTAQCSE